MAVRDKRTGAVAHKLHDEDITAKEFGEGDNNGKEAQTWKNREKDWYNAERRFIFSTQKKSERTDFIDKIMKDKVVTCLK